MTATSRGHENPGPALRWRVFGAMALVVVAGAATLLVVALLVAPAVFHRHLRNAGFSLDSHLSAHVDEGFRTAFLTAITAGVLAAMVIAATVAVLVARRIATPIADAAGTAGQLAAGDYAARVTPPRMGPELAELADSVNELAHRLESTESARIGLLTDVAHELRTPLASIEATVEAIIDGVIEPDPATLTVLSEQSRRLARLIDDLALISRADEHAFIVNPIQIDLRRVAAQATAAVAARFTAADVRLETTGDEHVQVRADVDRTAEVVGQLLDNALRHCRTGGTVTVNTNTTADGAHLSVTDTGEGFDPGEAELLFGRFYRGRNVASSTGSGIGLAIARALVSAQGGTLVANSPGPGRGATFTVTLPKY